MDSGGRLGSKNKIKFPEASCAIVVKGTKEPLMQEIRYLDKLIDELARGKTIEKILRG